MADTQVAAGEPFRACYSTLDPAHLQQWLAGVFPDLAIQDCRLLNRGFNDTYVVEGAGGRRILRAYRSGWRSEDQVRAEVEELPPAAA